MHIRLHRTLLSRTVLPFHSKLLYSHYKSHVTYKGLISVSPSDSITFVSELYDGSISDKEIVRKFGILEKELWFPGDSVIVDRGFTIENNLKDSPDSSKI